MLVYGAPLPRRRDARRNRAAIVRATLEAMSGPESSVDLSTVARLAGVGLATVYRHFPDRDALLAAVVAHQLDRLDAAVAAEPDCPGGFRRLLGDALRARAALRVLGPRTRRADTTLREARDRFTHRVIGVLAGPLRRAQDGGHVRADLAPQDLRLLFQMVDGVIDGGYAVACRAIDLMLDGLTAVSAARAAPGAARRG